MNKKLLIIIGLILILFYSILTISAANYSNPDYNLNIPDGYHRVNQSDNFVLLQSDKYHSISISTLDGSTDKDLLKYLLERSMYDFTYSTNYTKGSYDVEENYYNQEYQSGILYLCDNGQEMIVIDYNGPLGEDLEDSPVGVILDVLD